MGTQYLIPPLNELAIGTEWSIPTLLNNALIIGTQYLIPSLSRAIPHNYGDIILNSFFK